MKAANSKDSQKGFSLIGIVIIIIVVVAVLATVTVNIPKVNQQITNTQNPQTPSQTITGLDMVDGSNYTFYYPKGYIKLDKKLATDTVLYYSLESKKDTNERIISLANYPASTREDTPSSEFCMFSLKFFLRTKENVRIVEAKPVDFIKSHGCDFLWVDDNVAGKLAYHEKQLWYKEGNDISVYWLTATYLVTSPRREIETIDLAVNNFILK